MPFPLLALALPALIGAIGGVAYEYFHGRQSGHPATPGQLLRAGLVGGVLGATLGNLFVAVRLVAAPVATAAMTVPVVARGAEVVRHANEFVEDGTLGGRPAPPPAPPPPAPPAPVRPLFDPGALDRLAARLEASERARTDAGAPSADQVVDAMNGIADQIEAQRRELSRTAPPPAPTRGMAAALPR